MPNVPSMSSKQLVTLLETGGAYFVRQGKTDHAIYRRIVDDVTYSAPVQMGKKSLDPIYSKRVLKQLKFTNHDIDVLLEK
jgi:predicted RNA binding protein YcfA (HicA-like mRNA interferase family)